MQGIAATLAGTLTEGRATVAMTATAVASLVATLP